MATAVGRSAVVGDDHATTLEGNAWPSAVSVYQSPGCLLGSGSLRRAARRASGCREPSSALGRCLDGMTRGTYRLASIHVDLLATHAGLCSRHDVVHLDGVIRATRIVKLASPAIAFHNGEAHVSWCGPSAPSSHVSIFPATTTRPRAETRNTRVRGASACLAVAPQAGSAVGFLVREAPPGAAGRSPPESYLRRGAAFLAGAFALSGSLAASNRSRSSAETSTSSLLSPCRHTPSLPR